MQRTWKESSRRSAAKRGRKFIDQVIRKPLRLIFFLFAFSIATSGASQQPILRGSVVNRQTREGIPYVHIISTSGRGTISDPDGNFSIAGTNLNDSLRVSCIGYEAQKIPVRMLHAPLTIFMEEDQVLLPAVTLRALSAKEFIRKCVSKIHVNYSKPNNLTALYWRCAQVDDAFVEFSERRIKLHPHRIETDTVFYNLRSTSDHITVYDSITDIVKFDVISQGSMFVNLANLNDWAYEYAFSSDQEQYVVVEASMIQNPFKAHVDTNTLKIFIHAASHAMVRIDFAYRWPEGKRYEWKEDVVFTLARLDGTVEYVKTDSRPYALKYLSIETEFQFKRRYDPKIVKTETVLHELAAWSEQTAPEKPVVRWNEYLEATQKLIR